jgi:peptide/nickel transport system ATP-binding protein
LEHVSGVLSIQSGSSNVEPILSIRDLSVDFGDRHHPARAIDRVSFDIGRGERLGLVGESGSGKSVIARAIMGLIRPPGWIAKGSIVFDGIDLTQARQSTLNNIRGKCIALIPQDASLALNPVLRIGDQMKEMLARHQRMSRAEMQRRSAETLSRVGLADPERVMRSYSSELSGGMKQRVGIALALLCDPELLIADDPTSAVDVTIQAQILKEFHALTARLRLSVLFISHDLRVISTICSRVVVLYAGQINEIAGSEALLRRPIHPYTRALVRCSPTVETRTNPLPVVPGAPPDVPSSISGCRFHPRCPQAIERCSREFPPFAGNGHRYACWNPAS